MEHTKEATFIKIGVAGAQGRMGQRVIVLSQLDFATKPKPRSQVIGALIRPGSLTENAFTDRHINDLCLVDDQDKAFRDVEVIIDFTTPTGALENTQYAAENGKAIVIGTTGFTDSQMASIKMLAKKIPILVAPNMAIGVTLILEMLEVFGGILNHFYDTRIIESHHRRKKDSPSGTAIAMAGKMPTEVPIYSFRSGGIIGDHTIIFTGEEEVIEIKHRAISRDLFARGALAAAECLVKMKPGMYTMQNLLNNNSTKGV